MAKIMLVEDDNNLREIYGARLMAEGYQIVSAQDGEEALAIAVKEKPDLIISDVMMPRISGFDMLDILRNAPETKDTKVIMMTALSQAEDKSRADKLGADRYLVKSQVTLEDVTNVVHEVLGDVPTDSTASTDTPSVTPAPEPQPAAETPAPASTTAAEPKSDAASPEPQPTAPTVEVIANPDIKVPDEPAPGEIQAPPPPESITSPLVASAPSATSGSNPSQPSQPVIPAPNPSQFQPQTPPLITPSADDSSTSTPSSTATTSATAPAASISSSDDNTDLPPVVEPAKVEEVKPENIKVELPDSSITSDPAPRQPATTKVEVEAAGRPADSTGPAVGPNLAEALAAEEQQLAGGTSDATSATQTGPSAPSVINGAPAPTVVKPTKIEVATPAEETANPSTPDKKATGERVIQPLNDPGDKPDLEALLAAEEQKEAIDNPAANSVISPQEQGQPGPQPAPDQAPKQPPSADLNNIAI
jgi:CheY-like chemotaxis protein